MGDHLNGSTEAPISVEQILEDQDLLLEFLSDILFHAYLKYGQDYVEMVIEEAEDQVEAHQTQMQ